MAGRNGANTLHLAHLELPWPIQMCERRFASLLAAAATAETSSIYNSRLRSCGARFRTELASPWLWDEFAQESVVL